MPVKVLIERHVKEGKEADLVELLKKLRAELSTQPGYVSGELLQNLDDRSTIFAVSTWLSVPQWKCWQNNPKRLEIISQIELLLTEPPKVTITVTI